MPADITSFYILIFLLSAISLLAVALGVSYWLLFTKYKHLKEEIFKKQSEDVLSFQKNLDESEKKSLEILSSAQNAAKEIVSKADGINKDNKEELTALVQENLKDQQSSYDRALQTITQNVSKSFEDLPESVKNQVTVEIQKILSSFAVQMQEPYKNALKEVEEYKTQRKKAFEDNLFETLRLISKEVLRKELTIEEHEKLVLKSLENANLD